MDMIFDETKVIAHQHIFWNLPISVRNSHFLAGFQENRTCSGSENVKRNKNIAESHPFFVGINFNAAF